MSFGKTKILYSEERYGSESSRTANKGIYLSAVQNEDQNRVVQSVNLIKRLTSKEFMKALIEEDNFYDIPVYNSLLLPGQGMKYYIYIYYIYNIYLLKYIKSYYLYIFLF